MAFLVCLLCSEFPTEADAEDFTAATVEMDEEEEEEEQEEDEEEVVVDRDYYYDGYKDYNEEPPTEPSNEKSFSEKEIMSDVKGKRPRAGSARPLSVLAAVD